MDVLAHRLASRSAGRASTLCPLNITQVRWAREHDERVRGMVARAQRVAEALTSSAGMRLYVQELLRLYTRKLTYKPRRSARAVRFQCRPTGQCRSCVAHEGRNRTLCGTRCAFVTAGGRRFATLHAAAQKFPRASSFTRTATSGSRDRRSRAPQLS